MLECHGLLSLVYMLFGLLASTFKSTQRPSTWPGSPKDPTSTSKERKRSQARRVTQSDPCGLEPLQVRAALVSIFPLPQLCNHDVFIPAIMANKYIIVTVVPMFMILVVNTHARVISRAGVCGDRLATVVFRRGARIPTFV